MKKSLWVFTLMCYTLFLSSQDHLIHHNRSLDFRNPPSFNPDWAPFFHGVASGDPLADRVIIWTRLTPEDMEAGPYEISWRIATDPQLENLVQSGTSQTDATRDYTVKVDVSGLSPGTTYYYGFTHEGKHSLTGRTQTSPGSENVEQLRFGVVSCSNYQAGYFNAYRHLSQRNDLDAIIHLGDYIYEYADGFYGNEGIINERPLDPSQEIITLEEYRTRYSTYRLDTNLIRAHQQAAFITVWDDHETANDSYRDGAQNHTEGAEGSWEDRKAAGKQAYFEWMPIREQENQIVYRTIQYGDLVDLILLDTRLEGRQKQLDDVTSEEISDENRTILGETQKQWFLDQLSNSTAKWKVVGQQVVFSEFNVGWTSLADNSLGGYNAVESFFLDIWDGYPTERTQILDHVRDNNIDNVVILTGDFHSSFAFDVADHPIAVTLEENPLFGMIPFHNPTDNYDQETGEGAVAVEFATPSVTSANFDENGGLTLATILQAQMNNVIQPNADLNIGNPNPHMKYVDLIKHGYFLLDLNGERAQADWFHTDILDSGAAESFSSAWFTNDQDNHLTQSPEPSDPKAEQSTPAPPNPPGIVNSVEENAPFQQFALLGLYPNPSTAFSYLHYSLSEKARVKVLLLNSNGQQVRVLQDTQVNKGIYSLKVDMEELSKGLYLLQMKVDNQIQNVKILKQ
ncbi:MAG: alkaline phosphatase D family protein [Saprospiraceae bacterium]|nr:alkaline phosphatase D family protein [Saprospiraceae bacterium]